MTQQIATPPVAPTGASPEGHPLLDALSQLEAASSRMSGSTGAWAGLDTPTVRDACTRIRRVRARLDAQVIRASQALEVAGAASAAGATSTGALLASDFGGDRRESEALVRTGAAITKAGAVGTERLLMDGSITPQQAQIISRGLSTLPQTTSPDDRATCEQALLDRARESSLAELRRAADRVGAPVQDPGTVDAAENLTVDRRERRAWKVTEFSLTDLDDGTSMGKFRIPQVQAAMLRTLLEAQSAPRRRHLGGSSDASGPDDLAPDERENLTYPQRLGRALCALIEHVPTDGFATTGGTPAAVTVTIELAALRGEIEQKVAALGTGTTMSAGQARRLACEHGIIPAVLGGQSVPLDYGRTRRLFATAQRLALTMRDRGCAFPGCDRPPAWCESHHITPFSRGGTTDLRDGVLLCARHHHLVHQDHWQLRLHPDTGHPQFRNLSDGPWRSHARFRPDPRARSADPDPTPGPDPHASRAPARHPATDEGAKVRTQRRVPVRESQLCLADLGA